MDHAKRMSADDSFTVKVKMSVETGITHTYVYGFGGNFNWPPFPIVGHYWNRLCTLLASLPWMNAVGSPLEL